LTDFWEIWAGQQSQKSHLCVPGGSLTLALRKKTIKLGLTTSAAFVPTGEGADVTAQNKRKPS